MEFIKENWMWLAPVALFAFAFVITIIVLVCQPKKKKGNKVVPLPQQPLPNKKSTNIKYTPESGKSVGRYEKLHTKKCSKCGGPVPIEDNLCQNCGAIP